MSNSSIGRGPAFGGNENHDGDPESKTLGESVHQEPPAGNDLSELIDEAAPDGPAGAPGATAEPGVGKTPQAYPDGSKAQARSSELDAAHGKVPPP